MAINGRARIPSQTTLGRTALGEETMKTSNRFWRMLALPISFAAMLSIGSAAELNPAALVYKKPDQIP